MRERVKHRKENVDRGIERSTCRKGNVTIVRDGYERDRTKREGGGAEMERKKGIDGEGEWRGEWEVEGKERGRVKMGEAYLPNWDLW